MWFNIASFQIVHIAVRSFCQPLATAKFLAKPSLHIFNEVIRKILTLSERHLQHKFPLRSWLEPKLRKAQRSNCSSINEINYFSTINRVTGETIGVPSEDSSCFTLLNCIHHFSKNFSPGLLCAFRLLKFSENFKIFSTRKLTQFKKLSFNTHY